MILRVSEAMENIDIERKGNMIESRESTFLPSRSAVSLWRLMAQFV